jgi:hypothetical protein
VWEKCPSQINAVLWYYTFGQFHGNVTLVIKFFIYIFENNKSYVQNEAHFRRVRWELKYFTKKCNILTRFLVCFYMTNIRLLWKCPSLRTPSDNSTFLSKPDKWWFGKPQFMTRSIFAHRTERIIEKKKYLWRLQN